MKINKIKLHLIACAFLISLFVSTPAYAESISSISNTTSSASVTRKDDIRWRYRVIDGVLYKRQYNYSRGEWIGKWIKV
ncbi:hypothetical protein ACQRBN_13370 [Bariatricus sp. SGI.154]|uniref:hypothetical protein n=1 Tax=Bariatricus sp. SGI.154 TaxID=3420549 RepID=UPI003D03A4F6